MSRLDDQFEVVSRIAIFAAELRGHQLGEWRRGEDCAQAHCLRCGARLQVYYPAIQPDLEGAALESLCSEVEAHQAA